MPATTKRDSFVDIGRDARNSVAILIGVVALFWLVELANTVLFGGSLSQWGVMPRTLQGLPGILIHPFLHSGASHLLSNTLGFLLLGGMVMLREPRDFWMVFALGTVVGGVGIWVLGRPGPHIGASGVVFAYFGYLLFTGLFERRVGSILLSVVTFLLWGRLLLGLSPLQRGISWEGHLFGLFGGIFGAWLHARRRMKRSGLTST